MRIIRAAAIKRRGVLLRKANMMIGFENIQLKSERLAYRLLCDKDKSDLARILSDRTVTQPAGFMPAKTQAEFDLFFQNLTQRNTGIGIFLDNKLIGYLHVNPYRDDSEFFRNKKCISLGFVIGKDYQKQGYGTEMLKFLTDYLLLQFDACFADHFSENIPSKKVIINSGYIFNETYTMYFDELHCEKTCDSYFKSK